MTSSLSHLFCRAVSALSRAGHAAEFAHTNIHPLVKMDLVSAATDAELAVAALEYARVLAHCGSFSLFACIQ